MNFDRYKKELFDFDDFDSRANEGFEERLGAPTELEASIGLITIAFNRLDSRISAGITMLLGASDQIGAIVTSELSFKAKVNLFASLVKELRQTHYFNRLEGKGFEEGYMREFIKALFRCETLRNKIVHSSFEWDIAEARARVVSRKVTSKAKRGLHITSEFKEMSHFLNIYEFTVSMEMEVDEFFIDFKRLH